MACSAYDARVCVHAKKMCLRWRYAASCPPSQCWSTCAQTKYSCGGLIQLLHNSAPPDGFPVSTCSPQLTSTDDSGDISQGNVSHFISLRDLFFFSFYCCKMTKETEEMLCWAGLKVFAETLCEVIAMLHLQHLQHLQVMVIYPCGIQISYYHWCIIHCYISLPGDFICHFRLQWPHLPWNTGWDLSP